MTNLSIIQAEHMAPMIAPGDSAIASNAASSDVIGLDRVVVFTPINIGMAGDVQPIDINVAK